MEEEKTRVRPDIDGEEIRAGLVERERERERDEERGRLILESFNTGARSVGLRQTTAARTKMGKDRGEWRKGIFRMIGIVGARCEMQRTVGWIRLYSNGVAIRVMLEYIDYWGDQRVGNDGMTPVASSGEKDQGSKPPILFLLLSIPIHPANSCTTDLSPVLADE